MASATARRGPGRYRVLWVDAAGNGRYTDVEAGSEGEAAWKAAIAADSSLATFTGILQMPPGEDEAGARRG